MALFRWWRDPVIYGDAGYPHSAAIERFWARWAGLSDAAAAAVEDGDAHRLRALIDSPVREIHPDLAWHAGPGVRATFMLVVSGARHPALRVVAERWRRAGPPDSPAWEFHPATPAEPAAFEALVQVAGIELDPAEAVAMVQLDDLAFRMDVTVYHPDFARLDQVARTRVANVLVGWALGEDDADRWVGQITATTTRPLDSVPVALLGSLVTQLGDRWGGERWATLEGTFGQARLLAAVRHPLHRVDHPLFDEHIAVRLPYRTDQADGLPGDARRALASAEAAIVARLATNAILVAIQTASGERLLHFYADCRASPVETIRAALSDHTGGEATVQADYDPGWDSVDHLRIAATPG